MARARTKPTSEFAGRVAVVTGGSEGLGKNLVQTLVAEQCRVFFCGLDRRKGAAVAKSCGPLAMYAQADLADPAQVSAFIESVRKTAGHIDYLVNNAAIDPRIEFERATVTQFDQVIAVNLRSCFLTTQAAVPAMRKGRGKAIVNICTTNMMLGLSPFTVYNAAKAGIVGFTRSLARELGPYAIRANILSPGWIMTAKQIREHVTDEDRQELLRTQCIKHLLTPADVTPVTLFLLSTAARAISGQNIIVDGGKVHGGS